MLFPNIDNFVDQVVVEIFLSGNPMPFLLGDLYYSLHTCHEKKGGTLLCCDPLLRVWLMSHMPREGPFMSKELKWSQKLAFLTASNIKWYIRDWETKDAIFSCGEFPNMPLWGTMGCINYNSVLSMRQCYPMNGPPDAESLEQFILHDIGADNPIMKKVKKSWQKIIRKGKELCKRNFIVREPYTRWVKEIVQVVKLPYLFYPSIFP